MFGFGPPANRRARQEWWRRQIQRQQDGTLSIAEFCRRLGVSTVTFYAWRRRFSEAPSASPLISESPAAKSSTANGAPIPAFLPVSMLAAGPDGQLEIELANACVVRLKGTVDPALRGSPSTRPAGSATTDEEPTDAPSSLRCRARVPLHAADRYAEEL